MKGRNVLKGSLRYSFFIIIMLLSSFNNVYGKTGIGVMTGSGEEDTIRHKISIDRDWSWSRGLVNGWYLTGYWEAGVGYWKGRKGSTGNDSLFAISAIPVFRLQQQDYNKGEVKPYIDLAVGFYLLSRTSIGDKDISTSFQFGDHVGAGLRFGSRGEFEIGYRFEHISNASIKTPNPGINFHMLRFMYRF